MHIEIITVGPLREGFVREGVAEYVRRLRRYTSVALTAVPAASLPPGAGPAEVEAAVAKEGAAILARLGRESYVVALDERGELPTSPELAAWLGGLAASGRGRVVFVIGGARGLARAVLERADRRLALSRLTFTHEMACLFLLEQLYRAFKINRGETYHY